MNPILYRDAEPGDEQQIQDCMNAAADLVELTDGTPEGLNQWNQICDLKELQDRISSCEKTFVAIADTIIIGFIAFRRGNHLSLLFVRKEFARQGIGRELFNRCATDLNEVTVNASDGAVGFYQTVGFVKTGDRFFKSGLWATPMIWTR
jgi:GNAT superfamily N-acetyltransferase